MKIIGLRVHQYVGQEVSGHNCDFTETPSIMERHIVCLQFNNGHFYELTLQTDEGQCGSGWCTATYGLAQIDRVTKFSGFTHLPINGPIEIPVELSVKRANCDKWEIPDDFECSVFGYTSYGVDKYYPSGEHWVNMELFEVTPRAKAKRPVWIFVGQSAMGKSFIANQIKTLDVFETDSVNVLPEVIFADVVVVGNRSGWTEEDIYPILFGEPEVIVVDFQKISGVYPILK